MTEHQAILRSFPEGPQQQSPPTSPPCDLARLRGKVEDVLPGTVNTVRGATERAGQVPDLGNLPTLRGDKLEDILAQQEQEEVPVTPQRQVRFSTLTPIVRPVEQHRKMTQSLQRCPRCPLSNKAFSETRKLKGIYMKKASAVVSRQQPQSSKSSVNQK